MISMRDFIASGELGPVRLGMSREQVAALLGPPHATNQAIRQPRHPIIWVYGGAQLWFEERPGVLERIGVDYFPDIAYVDTSGIPRGFLEPWILHGGLQPEEAEAALQEAGLGFSKPPEDEDGLSLECESGVRLWFTREWSRDLRLASCSIRSHIST